MKQAPIQVNERVGAGKRKYKLNFYCDDEKNTKFNEFVIEYDVLPHIDSQLLIIKAIVIHTFLFDCTHWHLIFDTRI